MTDQNQPLNREQRRAQEFGKPDVQRDNPLHEADTNPAFGTGDDAESYAGRPDQDVVKQTGAGSGGATESDDRLTHHEGMHLGNQPNS